METLYALEPNLTVDEFRAVLAASTLAERRPADPVRLKAMLANANIIVTARQNGKLVGVARAITDYAYCCYLSDLAVATNCQGQGIGRRLIIETHRAAGPDTKLILTAAPAARTYYPHIGMDHNDSCWTMAYGKLGDS